jgi:hypothetical protein
MCYMINGLILFLVSIIVALILIVEKDRIFK